MAETNALLKRHTGNRIEGSNPSVSATIARLSATEVILPQTKRLDPEPIGHALPNNCQATIICATKPPVKAIVRSHLMPTA